jgi:hypothetical protein
MNARRLDHERAKGREGAKVAKVCEDAGSATCDNLFRQPPRRLAGAPMDENLRLTDLRRVHTDSFSAL